MDSSIDSDSNETPQQTHTPTIQSRIIESDVENTSDENETNSQLKSDLEYAELNPELYGLRRSGRAPQTKEFIGVRRYFRRRIF
jgi:hypothetical protein